METFYQTHSQLHVMFRDKAMKRECFQKSTKNCIGKKHASLRSQRLPFRFPSRNIGGIFSRNVSPECLIIFVYVFMIISPLVFFYHANLLSLQHYSSLAQTFQNQLKKVIQENVPNKSNLQICKSVYLRGGAKEQVQYKGNMGYTSKMQLVTAQLSPTMTKVHY